jgi:hypothetical protein
MKYVQGSEETSKLWLSLSLLLLLLLLFIPCPCTFPVYLHISLGAYGG